MEIKPKSTSFKISPLKKMSFSNVEHSELIYNRNIYSMHITFSEQIKATQLYHINFVINTPLLVEDIMYPELSISDYAHVVFCKKNGLDIYYETNKIIIPLICNRVVDKYIENKMVMFQYTIWIHLRHDIFEKFDEKFWLENSYIVLPENQNILFPVSPLQFSLDRKIICIIILDFDNIHEFDKIENALKRNIFFKKLTDQHPNINIKIKRGTMWTVIKIKGYDITRQTIIDLDKETIKFGCEKFFCVHSNL